MLDTTRVVFSAVGGGATEYLVDTPYYVISSAANTFQLSLTSGGAAIAGTSDSTGTWTLNYWNADGSEIVQIDSDNGFLTTSVDAEMFARPVAYDSDVGNKFELAIFELEKKFLKDISQKYLS